MSQEFKLKIMHAIQKGEVAMRPRWHFVLRRTLYVLGIAVCVLVLLFLSSFVLFALRANGVFFGPLFGLHGLRIFFFGLPHLLLFLTVLFIVVLEILTRYHGFTRKTPLLYSALAIIAMVLLAPLFIWKLGVHERMAERVMDHGDIPFIGGMYRDLPEANDFHRGRVGEIFPGGFVLIGRDGATTSVQITPDTRLPYETHFEEDDVVVVVGETASGTIIATGIVEVDEETFDHHGRGMRKMMHDSLEPPFSDDAVVAPVMQ